MDKRFPVNLKHDYIFYSSFVYIDTLIAVLKVYILFMIHGQGFS